MAAAGLIAVRKTVVRGDSTYEQTYHVRQSDVKKALKDSEKEGKKYEGRDYFKSEFHAKWSAQMEELGGDPKLITKWLTGSDEAFGVGGWTMSSTARETMGMRGAAAHLAGSDDAERKRLTDEDFQDVLAIEPAIRDPERYWEGDQDQVDKFKGLHEAYLREHQAGSSPEGAKSLNAIAQASQAMHPEEEIVLYRGVGRKQAQALRDAPGEEVELDVGVLSSFADDPAIAAQFARRTSGKIAHYPKTSAEYRKILQEEQTGGAVIEVRVPRSAIIVSYRAAPHLSTKNVRSRKEIIILTKGAIKIPKAQVHHARDLSPERIQSIKDRAKAPKELVAEAAK
jgi:hypothetical protein